MRVISTSYTLKYKSFDIYIAGCRGNPHCRNCHNPESWDFEQGDYWCRNYYINIVDKVKTFDKIINNIMIFGGEPLDQPYEELKSFLIDMRKLRKTIWMFTRYSLDEVPQFVKDRCDYIKCGRYIRELEVDNNIQYGVKLSTSNQFIFKKGVDY